MFRRLFYLFFLLLLVLVSCQNNSSTAESENSTVANEEESKKSSQPDPVYTKGLSLVAKSDCLTCHKIDDKLIGPSYKEIAVKYADAPNDVITALAKKIINGSVGNWGNVPMTPHPSISQDDAETMVRYILTLNK
jgi:cytochrome c